MRRLLCLTILLAASPAAAEIDPEPPPDERPAAVEQGYFGGGGALSLDHFINAAISLDGGLKLPAVPLWVRGAVELGSTVDSEGGGSFRRGRIGLETRGCVGPWLCALAGLEAGYQTQVWESDEDPIEHHQGAIVTGRAGLDVGGARGRLRLSLEMSRFRHASDVMTHRTRWIPGAGLALGFVYRL